MRCGVHGDEATAMEVDHNLVDLSFLVRLNLLGSEADRQIFIVVEQANLYMGCLIVTSLAHVKLEVLPLEIYLLWRRPDLLEPLLGQAFIESGLF